MTWDGASDETGGCGLICNGGSSLASLMFTSSGLRWGIPLRGGGGGPETAGSGVAGTSTFPSLSEPKRTKQYCIMYYVHNWL